MTTAALTTTPFVEALAARYSSAHHFRRAVAVWMQYKNFLMKRQLSPVTARELAQAEFAAILWLQRETWPQEIELLSKGSLVPRRSPIAKLSPKLAECVVMSSRTRDSLPIIPRGKLATLLIDEAHRRQGHLGRQSTAADVARHYWIIGMHQTVRKVVKGCLGCQRRHAKPMSTEMSLLPTFRLDPHTYPFETSGVDYFGPFHLRRGRASIKAYGVVFTCAVTRAIHLEVAEDLSGQSFLNALRRFVSRRGRVKCLISDHGTNFKGARATLNKDLVDELAECNHDQLQLALRERGIEWKLNPPGASHHGGFWERLIGSVRRILEAMLAAEASRPLTFEGFNTLMCEIESILNARPLTKVSDDINDMEALTPNHILIGRQGARPPPGNFSTDQAGALRSCWRQVQHMAVTFWSRWMKEYRVLLHQRSKWHRPSNRKLAVGDIVLVVEHTRPRDYWKLGRVTAVHVNPEDGQVRSAEVRTQDSQFSRPITKLCLLETSPT